VIVAVWNDSQWQACARVLGLKDLGEDASVSTNAGRLAARDRVISAVSEKIRGKTAAEWIERLASAGVPCGVVKSVLESLQEVDASALTGIAPSVPGTVRMPPPMLDEHGAQIRESGWGAFRKNVE